MTTVSIVIPCYNEQDGLSGLLTALDETRRTLAPAYQMDVVFVDDGSQDRTAERLQDACRGQAHTTLIRHPINRGLGAALRTGFAHATGELVATVDSDCTYDPREVAQMLSLLEQGADLVVASPYHPQGRVQHVPWHRQLLSRNLSRLYGWVVDPRISTYTSLFRLYRSPVLRSVTFQTDGFLAMAEILVNARLQGYRVIEHPTRLVARQAGASKAVIPTLVMEHLKFLARLVWRKLGPSAVSQPKSARRV
ncbi:MAG: glycosyltransferase family 2 protein [Candidatus Omnitrophota bacterium]|nr:glycosyltransferase family 2 protein [Candidatus Omnitrophota bacterium]